MAVSAPLNIFPYSSKRYSALPVMDGHVCVRGYRGSTASITISWPRHTHKHTFNMRPVFSSVNCVSESPRSNPTLGTVLLLFKQELLLFSCTGHSLSTRLIRYYSRDYLLMQPRASPPPVLKVHLRDHGRRILKISRDAQACIIDSPGRQSHSVQKAADDKE
jgi:hypothetical protein